jgi:hypothetical protein
VAPGRYPRVTTAAQPDHNSEVRVSTVELFFDLVFVFALTQLTVPAVAPDVPGDPPHWTSAKQVAGTVAALAVVPLGRLAAAAELTHWLLP